MKFRRASQSARVAVDNSEAENGNYGRDKEKKRHKSRKELPVTPETMRLQLAGICARSEQNEYDLRQKMQRRGLTPDEIDEIIDFLKSERFLDEKRFARAYANDKMRFAGWGVNKIRMGLKAKRVSTAEIEEALQNLDRKEYIESLKRVGIAKARTLALSTPEGRNKFYRYMLSRGFESELIGKLVDAILRKLSAR